MASFGRSISRRKSDCAPEDLLNDKLLDALRKDSIDDATIKEELHSATKEEVFPTIKSKWQRRLVHLMHSTPVEVLIVALVIIDVIILLTMLVLELHILELKLGDGAESTEQTISFLRGHCNENGKLANYSGHSLLTALRTVKEAGCHESSGHLTGTGPPSSYSNGSAHAARHKRAAASIDPDGGSNSGTIHNMEVAEHVLHFCSIFILGIMVVEVVLKVTGLGKAYFRGKMEIIDGIVIFVSFGMDLYFYRGIFADGFSNLATILVIFLLWRIARIFNAILVTAKTRLEFRIRVQKRARTHLTERITVLQTEIETLQEHVENLRVLCRNYKISEDALRAAEPLVVTSRRKSTSKALGSVLKMSVNLASGLGLTPNNAASRRPSMSVAGRAAQSGTAAERASLLPPSADANANIPSILLPTANGEPTGLQLQNGANHISIETPSKAEPSLADGDATADDVPLLDRHSVELRQPATVACAAQTSSSAEPSSGAPSCDTSPGSCCSDVPDVSTDLAKVQREQSPNPAAIGTACLYGDSIDRGVTQSILGIGARSAGSSEGFSERRFSQASVDGRLNISEAGDIAGAAAALPPRPETNGAVSLSDGPCIVDNVCDAAVISDTFDAVAKLAADQVVIIITSEH